MTEPTRIRDGSMPPDVLLSIIIPAYNYGHALRRAADSVLSQLRPDCELVVIDDGSTDDTPQVLEAIRARNPAGFRCARQGNAGAAAARNAGLRLSRGAYLLFFDADDELLPGALDAVCAAIRAHPQASVILGGRLTRRADGREKFHPPPARLAAEPCRRVADYLLRKRIGMGHGSTAARRDLVAGHGYPENLRGSEDIPVFASLFAYGVFAMVDQPLVRIYKHHDSLRHRGTPSVERAAALVEEIFRRLPADCLRLRGPYAARRHLSLCREALRGGDRAAASGHFRRAAKLDWLQILQPVQVRKTLKALLSALLKRD